MFPALNGIVPIPFVLSILAPDRGAGVLLARQVLELRNACEGVIVWIIYCSSFLELRTMRKMLMFKTKRAVGKGAEAADEESFERAGESQARAVVEVTNLGKIHAQPELNVRVV